MNNDNKRKIVIDTSIFVNPEIRKYFGETPTNALKDFLYLANRIPFIEFYMPPSIFKELLFFIDKDKIPKELFVVLYQKPPSKYEMSCPAFLFYELIEEMRNRINKGLRIAEQAVRAINKKKEGEVIQELRRKYRDALREGIVDSTEDVDLILLAKELNALLVTADKGVIKWAEKLGIKWLFPEKFKEYLMSLIHDNK